ncbi:MAG: hypothetical protein KYX69_19080 [Sphingomonas sp.]|uniref:hypothetical protein n=1 Tax=Sphingomonas sp. TaxID=28214 RepID=UPI00260810DF|nr:hypothetical protein [Sphingomonas sp.]MDK2769811.1 hypothetical protein [Sphingomonas sp.]
MPRVNALDSYFQIPQAETYSAIDRAISARAILAGVSGTGPQAADQEAKVVAGQSLEEKLFDALANAKIITSRVAMHLDLHWRDRFFSALDRIHDPDVWDDSDRPVTVESVKTFLRAMFLLSPLENPSLGLSPRGTILAGWKNREGNLTLDFSGQDMVTWSLKASHGDWDEPAAGITRIESLVERLEPYPQRGLFG